MCRPRQDDTVTQGDVCSKIVLQILRPIVKSVNFDTAARSQIVESPEFGGQ